MGSNDEALRYVGAGTGLNVKLIKRALELRQAAEDPATEQKFYLLNAWRGAPFYGERERAALAWAEAVTRLSNEDVPDEVYVAAKKNSMRLSW